MAQRSFSIVVESSGDGECFCWKISPEQSKQIGHWEDFDEEEYKDDGEGICRIMRNRQEFDNTHLYPGDILHMLNAPEKYRLTITIEDISQPLTHK